MNQNLYNLPEKLMQKSKDELKNQDCCTPLFFRLSNNKDERAFTKLLKENPNVKIHDTIIDQLHELIKSQNPSKRMHKAEIEAFINKHTDNSPLHFYGVWVYYPWSERLVHILDEMEFINLRTSRNKYKITEEERLHLSTKRVGVIGLSVGQSVSFTMAMERTFGELRIADFDTLEITNLNRLRSGIHNMGIQKTVLVAREIAEIDPFLKITCFHEGITEDNIESFLLGNGKLDVLIDECDDVDIKFHCRIAAKKYKIPVLMETSDRTLIDVERFDIEPERPILHGLINHLDISKLKDLKTNEDKIPYLAPMVGIDTMSYRLKASAVEVGQSIGTWPQLASAVVVGGGAVADIWRRIALNQFHESGRYFVDMEELVGNKVEKKHAYKIPVEPLTNSEIKKISKNKKIKDIPSSGHLKLDEAIISELIRSAIMAPSGGNSQPWKWFYKDGALNLFFDKYYGFSFMDFEDRSSYIALGAAIENLILKTHELGIEININYFPLHEDKRLVAVCYFFNKPHSTTEDHSADELITYISKRYTNRKVSDRKIFSKEIFESLKYAISDINGAILEFFEQKEELEEIGEIIAETDRFRLLYPQSHADFIHQEMRWNTAEAQQTKNGIEVSTLELRPSELVGLKLIRDPKVVEFLKQINGGSVFKNVSRNSVTTASAIGFLMMPSYKEIDYLCGGRAAQRIWLTATKMDVAFQPLNVPLPYFARLNHDVSQLPSAIVKSVENLYQRFTNLLNHKNQQGEIMLFRIFKAEEPADKALRRPTNEILLFS